MQRMKSVSCFTVLGSLALAASSRAADTLPVRPNILIMLADDLGYADIGVNGCTDFATPNIDSIAQNGVRFSSGYVSAPVCAPSRAGLLTGRCQTRFGFEFNHFQADISPFGLPVAEKTVAKWLQEAGFATGHIGKWHLGSMRKNEFRPESRGFDESVWFEGQKKLPPLYYFRHGGIKIPEDTPLDAGAERIAKFYCNPGDPKFREAGKSDAPYVDIAMADEAKQFIEKNQAQPWFLYVAFLSPHTPLAAPATAEKEFSGIADEKRRKCAAMVTQMDRGVGEVLKALRDSGQEERTLIVFLSDNGAIGSNGSKNTPFRGMKGTLLEGGIRIPFVMQWKGMIPGGQTVDAPVSSLDILPTALAADGVSSADAKFDGVNLLPFLTGKTSQPPHDSICWRYGKQMAIRCGDWKLSLAADSEPNLPGVDPDQAELPPRRLYKISEDVGEKNDLSAAEPEKVRELQAKWDEWNQGNIGALWNYISVAAPE
jgi:arylsulfatase A-like enzyme